MIHISKNLFMNYIFEYIFWSSMVYDNIDGAHIDSQNSRWLMTRIFET